MKRWLLILGISTSFNTLADFNSALELYSAGDYAVAHKEFLSMAEVGEKRSQFNLGVMYYYGQHVEKDINKAYAWMKLSIQSEASKDNEVEVFKSISSEVNNKKEAENEFEKLNENYSTQVLLKKLYPVLIVAENTNGFDAVPVNVFEPKYPKEALYKGLEGWVRFQFDLDKQGTPRNIQLFDSFPEKIFVKNSMKAIKHWKFEAAKNEANQPISRESLRYTMQFKIVGAGDRKIEENLYQETSQKALDGDANAQYAIGYWDKKIGSPNNINPNEWFLKAAMQGHPSAQYELGRSLVYGQGCQTDKTKGIEWLNRSASNGQDNAKLLLGSLAMKFSDLASQKRALKYLDDVKELSAPTRLSYVWMLATSPFEEISNPIKAIELTKSFSSKEFKDDATLYEIKAAAYAAMGDFEKAVDLQEEALDEAEDMNADLTDIKKHLVFYKKKKKWF
jgi:uncharacterized protein